MEGKGVEDEASRPVEYVKPHVTDYGDLRELTSAQFVGRHTDVPHGTTVPAFPNFS